MGENIVEGLAWISTALAVSVVAYYTKEPVCLWGLIFPIFTSAFNRIRF